MTLPMECFWHTCSSTGSILIIAAWRLLMSMVARFRVSANPDVIFRSHISMNLGKIGNIPGKELPKYIHLDDHSAKYEADVPMDNNNSDDWEARHRLGYWPRGSNHRQTRFLWQILILFAYILRLPIFYMYTKAAQKELWTLLWRVKIIGLKMMMASFVVATGNCLFWRRSWGGRIYTSIISEGVHLGQLPNIVDFYDVVYISSASVRPD